MLRAIFLGDLHINGLGFLNPYVKNPDDMVYRTLDGIVAYAQRHNIRYLFQMGDVFHGPNPLQKDQERFLDYIERSGLMWFIQLGNHDVSETDKHSLIMSQFYARKLPKQLKIFTRPGIVRVGGVPICMLPWPHAETLLQEPGITCAHIALKGYRRDNGSTSKTGHEVDHKRGYWLLGDIHTEQRLAGWAHYIGTPYQRTFGESLPKGFCDVQARVENGRLFVKDEFIVHKPPYELVNLAISSDADLEKMRVFDPDDIVLYKLKISGGYQLPPQFRKDNPHVVDTDYGRAETAKVSKTEVVPVEAKNLNDPLKGLEKIFVARGLTPEQITRGMQKAETMIARL